jgi:acetoin:2,6-dichlorophenolindophenol oxidoreductase subunit alpha
VTEPTTVARDQPGTPEEAGHYLELYRRMRFIRRFEDEVQSLFQQGLVHGTTHLCSGQEAGPVGVCSALGDEDRVAGTYRGHGHALALGVEPEGLLAELLGRATGVCAGRAGSMNVIDLEHGLIGCFGIVGGSIGAATGAGMSAARDGRVVAAFFGDGAANQGYFHECLNFAQVMRLPVIYVCENNGYGEFTPTDAVTAGADIAARAAVLDIPAQKVDGNDLEAVGTAAREAVERARSGGGPSFIEALTYRHVGHSKSDPGAYRPEGELDRWLARDPLAVMRARLVGELGVEEHAVADSERSVEERIEHAVDAALAGPYPDPSDAAREYAP